MNFVIYIAYSDIGYNNKLDIVVIWSKIPCPHHYQHIHYTVTIPEYGESISNLAEDKEGLRVSIPNNLLDNPLTLINPDSQICFAKSSLVSTHKVFL